MAACLLSPRLIGFPTGGKKTTQWQRHQAPFHGPGVGVVGRQEAGLGSPVSGGGWGRSSSGHLLLHFPCCPTDAWGSDSNIESPSPTPRPVLIRVWGPPGGAQAGLRWVSSSLKVFCLLPFPGTPGSNSGRRVPENSRP